MAQLQAGYWLKSIAKWIANHPKESVLRLLTSRLSHFEFSSNLESTIGVDASIARSAISIITRGIPSYTSTFLENAFTLAGFDLSTCNSNLLAAFHTIEPRIKKELFQTQYNNKWGTKQEEALDSFYYAVLPAYLGEFAMQLVERNKKVNDFLTFSDRTVLAPEDDLLKTAKFDFFFDYPYTCNSVMGVAVQIESETRKTMTASRIEKALEQMTTNLQLAPTLRIQEADLANVKQVIKPLQDSLNNEYIQQISSNYYKALYLNTDGLDALCLALSPIAIARVQRAILEAIAQGVLKLSDANWNIAIFERDVPCSILAIEDLKQILTNLLHISGKAVQLPVVDLTIYTSTDFESNKINKYWKEKSSIESISIFNSKDIPENAGFQLFIDVSILQSETIGNGISNANLAKAIFVLRSSVSIRSFNQQDATLPLNFVSLNLEQQNLDGLQYFIAPILGFQTLRISQRKQFNLLSGLESALLVSTPASGKTSVWQFFASLQAGFSLCLTPTYTLAKELAIRMAANGATNILVLDPENIQYAQIQKIRNAGFSLLIASADVYCHAEVKEAFKTCATNGYFANSLFVEEAQCFSTWSADYRPLYTAASVFCSNLFSRNNKPLPIYCFANSLSNDVLTDIQSIVNIDSSRIEQNTRFASNLNFQLSDIRLNNLFYNTESDLASASVANRKQVAISVLINDNLNKTENKKPFKTLLLTPKAKGPWGMVDLDGKGLSEKLIASFTDLKSGFSLAIDDELASNYMEHLKPKIKDVSNDTIKAFRLGQLDLLASVNSFANGSYRDDVEELIINHIPNSPEALMSAAFKAGRNGNKARVTVLYGGQLIQVDEELDSGRTGVCRKIDITPDVLLQKDKLSLTYPGRRREMNNLNELLTQITYGNPQPIDAILEKIEDLFGFIPDYQLLKEGGVDFLKLFTTESYFGTINLEFLTKVKTEQVADKIVGDPLIDYFFSEITSNCPTGQRHVDWLFRDDAIASTTGILQVLETLEEGQTKSLTINLENGSIHEIAELLARIIPGEFTNSEIRRFALRTTDSTKFLLELNKTKQLDSLQLGLNEKVRDLFFTIRTGTDTLKIISRLFDIQVIKDFSLDLNKRKITFQIIKQKTSVYVKAWSSYLERHMLTGTLNKYIETLDKSQVLRGILEQMVDFTYTDIYPKRLAAIATVNNLFAAQVQTQGKTNECTASVIDFFGKINTARYALPYVQGNLVSEILANPKPSFNTALRLQADCRGLKDNIWHLLRSSELLLKDNPEQFALLMINGFAGLMLNPQNPLAVDRYLNTMTEGFAKMFISEKLSQTEYLSRMSLFVNKLFEYDRSLKLHIESVLLYKHHLAWLKSFNRRFAMSNACG